MPLQLKSLELQGYKTFANRTLFDFGDSVTVIVGPNGSGKSNIADSIRWVLGEQSYSLLRGKKTEDMIFSGSEQRSRSGMASATITFDNSDGWLPIDFNEVAITRRAYRDGHNEYLINGQRMRLKDVSELLAQSGLAERTYTIIGQGLVDAALSLKAEERRRLFEEAAGIGLYRTRRAESLRRLEATNRNLERVNDIMLELAPRMRTLERQARRTGQFDQIKSDLKAALQQWYGYHWHLAQNEVAQAMKDARSAEQRLINARDQHDQRNSSLLRVRERIFKLRNDLHDWNLQLAKLNSKREVITRDLAVTNERYGSFEMQQQRTQNEIAQLQEEIHGQEDRLEFTVKEVKRIKTEFEEAKAVISDLSESLNERIDERSGAEKELNKTFELIADLNKAEAGLQLQLSEREVQLERDTGNCSDIQGEIDHALRDCQEKKLAVENAKRDRDQAIRTAENASGKLRDHQRKINKTEAELKEQYEIYSLISGQTARLQARLDVLDQAENALTGYASGTRMLLQAARDGKLDGVRGPLGSFINVPKKYESAVAAALGEYLDAVLLEADPDRAVDLLVENMVRGVLLPIDFLTFNHNNASDHGGYKNKVIANASKLITVSDDIRPIVDLLLNNVWIVSDRKAARQVLDTLVDDDRELSSMVRIATLSGELYSANGPILIGGYDPDSDDSGSILSRDRQRSEINEQLAETNQKSATHDEETRRIQDEIDKQLITEVKLTKNLSECNSKVESSIETLHTLHLEEEQAYRFLEWKEQRLAQLEADISSGVSRVQELKSGLSTLSDRLNKEEEQLKTYRMTVAGLSMDDQYSRITHQERIVAVLEQRLTNTREIENDRRELIDGTRQSLTVMRNRYEELERSKIELEHEITLNTQKEADLENQISELNNLVVPSETELEQVELEQVELQKVETEARKELSSAEHQNAQARISLASQKDAMQTLKTRIEDDMGLVAYEYSDQISGPTPLPFEGLVEELPIVEELSAEAEENVKRRRAQLRRLGPINPEAQSEYAEIKQRYDFLEEQVVDLHKADADIRRIIGELDEIMKDKFCETFELVAEEFKEVFTRLFNGGAAHLILTDPDDITDTGIDIEARLPGRRSQGLSLLSGGERSLTATALIFSLLKVSPTPFCLLDEVDAMLDETNLARFRDLLRELSSDTQFVIVTHNRNTVQAADVIYGVTMGRDSVSQVVSLKPDHYVEKE